MRLGPLRNAVRGMTVALLLVLESLRAEGLLGLGEVGSSGIEGLGRKHGAGHHRHVAGVGGELRAIGLQLLAGELLVHEHVPDTVLGGDVVVELAVE